MSPHCIQFRISAPGDITHRGDDEDVGLQPGIWSITIRELADERQVEFNTGAGQAQEEEGPAVDAALIAAGRLADQRAQVVLPDGLRKLEGGGVVRGADQDPQAPGESGGVNTPPMSSSASLRRR